MVEMAQMKNPKNDWKAVENIEVNPSTLYTLHIKYDSFVGENFLYSSYYFHL